MAPAFIFRIDEFTEHSDAIEQCDENGKWIPTSIAGYNIRISGGASGQWWFCNGLNIQPLPGWRPEPGSNPYKTFSTIYSGGTGFHVLRGDATNPPASETWQHLLFDWDTDTYSSALTNVGQNPTLRVQDSQARWPRMLLPDIYHGTHYAEKGYGGLTGDLAIFLSLVALSMRPERLTAELPRLMHNSHWLTHSRSHGRSHKRGVIVYVYPYNDNNEELEGLEDGDFGMYYQ